MPRRLEVLTRKKEREKKNRDWIEGRTKEIGGGGGVWKRE